MILLPHGHYLSVREYARLSGLSVPRIYQAIEQGNLQCYKVDKTILIPKSAGIKYTRNMTGNLKGISKLKRGDTDGFLRERGYEIE